MQPKKILFELPEIVNRLDALNLNHADLLEVVEGMVAARNSCTENDPPQAPGWESWRMGTRRLHEIHTLKGWEKNEDNHISSIFHPKLNLKVAVCNTDAATGIKDDDAQPQNRSKKGAATEWVVTQSQMTLFQELNVIQLSGQPGGAEFWYLCIFHNGEIIRAELSCPLECSNGFFKSFRERIILIGDDGGSGGVRRRQDNSGPDSGEEFEISVVRKKA